MKRVNLSMTDSLHTLIKGYADKIGVPMNAWIIFALNTRAASWAQLGPDGKLHGGRNKKVHEKKTNKQEADTKESEPVEKPVYTTEATVLAAYKEHAGPVPAVGYLKWMEKYEEFRDEFYRP